VQTGSPDNGQHSGAAATANSAPRVILTTRRRRPLQGQSRALVAAAGNE
jgi:hypothetical protein